MDLTNADLDALKEIASIGSGNATTSLSKMINAPIDISMPEIHFDTCENVISEFSDSGYLALAEMFGDIAGKIIFLFNRKDVLRFVEVLMVKEKGTLENLNDVEKLAFEEVINIVSGAYMNALADFFEIRLLPSHPEFLNFFDTTDIAKMIGRGQKVLVLKSQFMSNEEGINNMYLIFNEKNLEFLLNIIEMKRAS
ncbi:hypothetical protein C0585_02750 [Candidatus Woesearchaeota archaeon]|nr:MAG: hypothetical protein C0585_02750 [Candidatus Woesearchaeota archaeon]